MTTKPLTGDETMTNEQATIYNETATSLATILEYIQLPNHPFHAESVERANAFVEAERAVRSDSTRRMMRDQMEYMSEGEWSSIVD